MPILQLGLNEYLVIASLTVPTAAAILAALFSLAQRIARLETKVDLLMEEMRKRMK